MNTVTKVQSFPGLLNEIVNFGFDKVFNEDFSQVQTGYKAPTNISEFHDNYLLEIAAPGRTKEDFAISIEKNYLTVSTVKKETIQTSENEPTVKSIKREFSLESLKRSFKLSEKVDATNISAQYENGILTITIPKKEEVKVTPVNITVS